MHEKSSETGRSATSIITSLHRPDQLYARLDLHRYRTGLNAFILTIVLTTVSVFLAFNPEIVFFMNNPPSLVWQVWSPKLSFFIMTSIPMILGNITLFLASSVILALIIRYFFHESIGFSVPFTIASISCAAYFLLCECVRWIVLVLLAFNPSYDLHVGGYLYFTVILNFVLLIAVILVFFWYMARGIVATFGVPARYAILISSAIFVIAQVTSVIVAHLVGSALLIS